MGNTLGAKKTAKVMKITGETVKLKTPIQAGDILNNYPGHVLFESEEVKHLGIQAKPLELQQNLEPKRLYFLIESTENCHYPRRVQSAGINMSAKDKLESLMLSRRSSSDLSVVKQRSIFVEETKGGLEDGIRRVRMRVPKAEVEKLARESKNEAEATERLVGLFMGMKGNGGACEMVQKGDDYFSAVKHPKRGHAKAGKGIRTSNYQKRVSFLPMKESRKNSNSIVFLTENAT